MQSQRKVIIFSSHPNHKKNCFKMNMFNSALLALCIENRGYEDQKSREDYGTFLTTIKVLMNLTQTMIDNPNPSSKNIRETNMVDKIINPIPF